MRSRFVSAVGSAVFLVIAPGTLAGWIPWRVTRWRFGAPFFGWGGTRVVGAILILAGVPVLLEAFARFALVGRGTPAPVAAPERLVVSGLYRYVRNPMYLAVLSVGFGQALLFGSRTLLWYAAVVGLAFHLFELLYEEPTLRRRFGDEYDRYRAAVPRWWPKAGGYEA